MEEEENEKREMEESIKRDEWKMVKTRGGIKLFEENECVGHTKENTSRVKRGDCLESIQKQIVYLLVQHKNGLTVKEICEMDLHFDAETINVALSELSKKGLVCTGDEQGKNKIWRVKYFLEAGAQRAIFLLSDRVSAAILDCIVETGGCTREDIMRIDAVVEESEFLITELKHLGLIEIEQDAVIVTEKGKKLLEYFQDLEELLEG